MCRPVSEWLEPLCSVRCIDVSSIGRDFDLVCLIKLILILLHQLQRSHFVDQAFIVSNDWLLGTLFPIHHFNLRMIKFFIFLLLVFEERFCYVLTAYLAILRLDAPLLLVIVNHLSLLYEEVVKLFPDLLDFFVVLFAFGL